MTPAFKNYRDLVLIELPDRTLVISCDSAGGIGNKTHDALFCPPELLGANTARTALMEVLCIGANPLCLVDTLCCEMNPTGEEILRGIRKELDACGIEIPVSGSTEENFPAASTGVGITLLAAAAPDALRAGPVMSGDLLVLAGVPLLGKEVLSRPDEMASYADIRALLDMQGVREIVPVGSRGILAEANDLAALHGLCFAPLSSPPADLKKSAGPSSCLIAAVAGPAARALPYPVIGAFCSAETSEPSIARNGAEPCPTA